MIYVRISITFERTPLIKNWQYVGIQSYMSAYIVLWPNIVKFTHILARLAILKKNTMDWPCVHELDKSIMYACSECCFFTFSVYVHVRVQR